MLPNEIMSKIVCLTKRYEKCPYKSNLFTPKSTISFKMKYLTVFSLLILFSSANCEGNGTVRGCAGKPLSKIYKPIQIYNILKGQDGTPCIFPFDYYGTVYYSCIKVNGKR